MKSSETVTFYQDRKNGASFMINTNNSSSFMVATFFYQGHEYAMEPSNGLKSNEKNGKYKISKLKRNPMSDSYSFKSGVDRLWFFRDQKMMKSRQKRQSTNYKIELFFIVDFSIYNYWFTQSKASNVSGKDTEAKERIREFYSFVVNGIDVRYKNIQTTYTISILFSGIFIADMPSKSQFIESLKVTSSAGTQVDSSKALDSVQSWIQTTSGLPQHDHAMMFTRYDFTRNGSTAAAGLAYLSALCTDQSVSVVEDHFNFNLLTTAAHELGHSLGAVHDGDNNTCTSADAYIMATTSIPVDNQNPWKFSICSVSYFTAYIKKLNEQNNNCMIILSSGYDPSALQKYTSLPGEVYDANSQCQHINGPGSSLCKNAYSQNFSSICTKLWCRKTDGSGRCTSSVGGDGLRCGNKKWCISGQCIYDECAPPGDENCLYGDSEGIVLSYPDKNITCSFMDIKSRPYACYIVETQCCQQCKHFHTGITGCEYGDRAIGCSKLHCSLNPDLCCGTCYDGPALTTPSQEPTTPKYEHSCKTTSGTTSTLAISKSTTSQKTTTMPTTTTQQTTTPSAMTTTTQQTTTPSAKTTTIQQTTTSTTTTTTQHTTTPSTIITTTQQTTTPSARTTTIQQTTTSTTTTTTQHTTTPSTITTTTQHTTTPSRTTTTTQHTTTPSTTTLTTQQTTIPSTMTTAQKTTSPPMTLTTTNKQTTKPLTTISTTKQTTIIPTATKTAQQTTTQTTTTTVPSTTPLSTTTSTTQLTTTPSATTTTTQHTTTPSTTITVTPRQSTIASSHASTQITEQTGTTTMITKQQTLSTTPPTPVKTTQTNTKIQLTTMQQATTTRKTPNAFVFRLTIIFLIEEFVDDTVINKVQDALTSFYQTSGLKFFSCTVQSLRKGSLIVDYEIQTPKTSQSIIQMTALSKNMVSGKLKVAYEGQEVTVSSVTLKDTSRASIIIRSSTSNCEVQSIVSPCPTGYTCEDMSIGPACRENSQENVDEKYRNYIIIVGVCAVILVIIFVWCICYYHIKWMSKRRKSAKDRMFGVNNLAMDDIFIQKKQYHNMKA
nr:location of vulva defective 1-like isoform X2 [Crassostrea virginica]